MGKVGNKNDPALTRVKPKKILIVSQNLATTSNFVEFQDSRNFTFFEARKGVRDM